MKHTHIWPCTLRGDTTGMNKRPRRIRATIEGAGDVRAAIFKYMANRPRAWEWYGVELTATTPLGQHVRVLYETFPYCTNALTDPTYQPNRSTPCA
jgi:hypothetical protein